GFGLIGRAREFWFPSPFGRGVGGECVLAVMQRVPNRLQHRFGILQHIMIPESQHMDAFLRDKALSLFICAAALFGVMLATVKFNCNAFLVAIKIEDVGIEWMLPAELAASKPPVTQ